MDDETIEEFDELVFMCFMIMAACTNALDFSTITSLKAVETLPWIPLWVLEIC